MIVKILPLRTKDKLDSVIVEFLGSYLFSRPLETENIVIDAMTN